MAISEQQALTATAQEKEYEISDGDGLSLRVRPCGSKSWRFRFRLDGRQSHISLGTLSKVPLALARQLAAEARLQVQQGAQPCPTAAPNHPDRMKRNTAPLSALQVKNAVPRSTDYGLSDGGGLSLWVRPCGSKSWRFRFRLDGKQSHISLGPLSKVPLALARQLAAEARALVAQGRHPGIERKAAQAQAATERASTFKAMALEWHEHKTARWSQGYAGAVLDAFENDVFQYLGAEPLSAIKPREWLAVFRRIESRGALEKLRKVRQRCGEVYRFAIATGRAEYNPIADVGGALRAPEAEHYPFLPVGELPALLVALRACRGHDVVKLGARLLILTGVRTAELRGAPWAEFDLDAGLWSIPAERMKKRRPHLVPLSCQALEVLRELQAITGGYTLAFPGRNDPAKPMSEAAINQLLKRCGYDGKATGHGFRHTLSTTLHEQGYASEWVETQLAHVDKNTIRGTYNHAQYLEGRRGMLQWYADHLDALAHGGNVVAMRRA